LTKGIKNLSEKGATVTTTISPFLIILVACFSRPEIQKPYQLGRIAA